MFPWYYSYICLRLRRRRRRRFRPLLLLFYPLPPPPRRRISTTTPRCRIRQLYSLKDVFKTIKEVFLRYLCFLSEAGLLIKNLVLWGMSANPVPSFGACRFLSARSSSSSSFVFFLGSVCVPSAFSHHLFPSPPPPPLSLLGARCWQQGRERERELLAAFYFPCPTR